MLDSCLRGLSAGTKVIATVGFCNMGTELYRAGIRDGQLIEVTVEKSGLSGEISFKSPSNPSNELRLAHQSMDAWFIFEGTPDGNNFICADVRKRAEPLISSVKSKPS